MLFTALTVNLDILVNFAHICEAKFQAIFLDQWFDCEERKIKLLMNVQIKYQEI